MFITNFVEEVNLVFAREQCGPNAVDRCITPSLMHRGLSEHPQRGWEVGTNLIVETTCSFQMVNISCIGRGTPEVHICNFKIGPDCEVTNVSVRDHGTRGDRPLAMTEVILFAMVIGDEAHSIVFGNVFRMLFHEV